MCQLNILLIYSNEKGREELTSFLSDNGFTVKQSFHAIQEINLKGYPDVAIIQPGIYTFLEIALNVRAKFPATQTLCSNGRFKTSLHNGFSYEELKEILQEERLLKRQRILNCVAQIEGGLYFQNTAIQENGCYEPCIKDDEPFFQKNITNKH